MQDPIRSKIYKEVSSQTGVDQYTVNQLVQFMFGEVKRTMQEGDLRSIDLQYLGGWNVKPYRREKLEDKGRSPKKKNHDRN